MRRGIWLIAWLIASVPAFAQDQPVTAAFNLSADHTLTDPSATGAVARVTRYELRVTPTIGTVLVRDIGKPAGANGASVSVPLALPSGSYSSGVVCAIGLGGEGCSTPAPPFTVAFPPTVRPRAPGTPTFK